MTASADGQASAGMRADNPPPTGRFGVGRAARRAAGWAGRLLAFCVVGPIIFPFVYLAYIVKCIRHKGILRTVMIQVQTGALVAVGVVFVTADGSMKWLAAAVFILQLRSVFHGAVLGDVHGRTQPYARHLDPRSVWEMDRE